MCWGDAGESPPRYCLGGTGSTTGEGRETKGCRSGGAIKADPTQEDIELVWPHLPWGSLSSGLGVHPARPTSPRAASDPSNQQLAAFYPWLLKPLGSPPLPPKEADAQPQPQGHRRPVRKGCRPPHPPQSSAVSMPRCTLLREASRPPYLSGGQCSPLLPRLQVEWHR